MNSSTLQTQLALPGFISDEKIQILPTYNYNEGAFCEKQKVSCKIVNFFGDSMQRAEAKSNHIANALALALRAGNIHMFYQPKVDLQKGIPVGAEALVRWKSEDGHIIYPDEFLPFVQNTECLAMLDRYVLESAMRQSISWKREGIAPVISVNISPHNYSDPNFVRMVVDLMEKLPEFEPSQLAIEILETVSLSDTSVARAILIRLRDMGIRFYLDDFGTGRSSAACLKLFPIDSIKIDKGFIHELPTGPNSMQNHAIVEATILVAHAFGVGIIAEGVETPAQAREMNRMGVATGQGFLFAEAMDSLQFARWYANTTACPFNLGQC